MYLSRAIGGLALLILPLAVSAQTLKDTLAVLNADPSSQAAFTRLESLAETDPRAKAALAQRLLDSDDRQMQERGVVLAKDAGEAGVPEGWMIYGTARLEGLGMREQSKAKARSSFELAAGLGSFPALKALESIMSETADEAWQRYIYKFQNETNPKRLLRQEAALRYAAMKGHPGAIRQIGMRMLRDARTPVEEAAAFRMLVSVGDSSGRVMRAFNAAVEGDAEATRSIAHEFLRWEVRQQVLPESEDMAIRWLVRAADSGSVEALSDLGWLYAFERDSLGFGKGTRIDAALSLLTLAVERGSQSASERLDRLTAALKRKADREDAQARALAMIAGVIVAIGTAQEMNAPYMSENDWGFDPCASTRGLALYGGAVGAASLSFGCGY